MKRISGNAGGVKIRRARPQDAPRIAALCGQLGYPTSTKQMAARLRRVLHGKSGACFLAETAQDSVIGWVHLSA